MTKKPVRGDTDRPRPGGVKKAPAEQEPAEPAMGWNRPPVESRTGEWQ